MNSLEHGERSRVDDPRTGRMSREGAAYRCIVARALAAFVLALLALWSGVATAATYAWTTVPLNWIDPTGHTVISAYSAIAFRTYGGCGTGAPVTDDNLSDVISLGFMFRFGSIYVDSVRVMSNGRVQFLNQNPWYGGTFDNAYCGYGTPDPVPFPNGAVPYTMKIYGADLDPTNIEEVPGYGPCSITGSNGTSPCYVSFATIGSAPYRRFVVTWNNVPEWSYSGQTGSFLMQVIVAEEGSFTFQYGNIASGSVQQLGWQADPNVGDWDVPYVGALPPQNLAVFFYPPGTIPNSITATGGTPQITVLNSNFPGALQATVKDIGNNPVPGVTVNFTVPASGPSAGLSALSAVTDANGVATVTATANGTAGSYVVSATVANVATAATFSLSNVVVSSFNAVEAGANAVTGKLFTKIAGQDLAFDVVALDGSNNVATTFTGTVKVEVVDSTNAGACNAYPVIATLANQTFVAGDSGRHALGAGQQVTDAYQNARIRISYPAASPTVVACSGDNFAVRPSFLVWSATDLNALLPGVARSLVNVSDASSAIYHRAGRPFRLTVSGVNADGVTASTNYSGAPTAVVSPCNSGTACTASVGTLDLSAGWIPFAKAGGGGSRNTGVWYSEVGSFTLQLEDSTWAAVDASDGTPAAQQKISSAPAVVGRFAPDALLVTPVALTPRTDIASCSGSSFTYMAERFDARFTVTAVNRWGATTTLYEGALARLPLNTPSAFGFGAVNGPTNLTTRVNTGLGTTGTWTAGVANVTAILSLDRAAAPDGPFDGMQLGANPIDLDATTLYATDYNLDVDSNGTPDHRVLGTMPVRFGRLRLQNAVGSQLLELPIPMEVQYWNGAGFVRNGLDSCTSMSAANFALGNYQKNLGAGQTTLSVGSRFAGGVASLKLSAPGNANYGSVDVSFNLSGASGGASCTGGMPASSALNRSYLQGAWCTSAYSKDPTARATFGLFNQNARVVYSRENY